MRIGERALRLLSRLPVGIRRRMLRVAWRAWSASFPHKVPDYGATPILETALGTGRREARRIEREIHFFDLLQSLEWLAAGRNSLARVRMDGRALTFDNAEMLQRLAATGEPIVLAPLHMGNFPLGLATAIDRFFAGRRVLILRARDDLDIEGAAMRRLNEVAGELRIVTIRNKREFLEAIRFARQGGVVICFADLPASYGRPANVRLFGQPARLAFGMDALARAIRAVVLPLAVRSDLAGDRVLCGMPFEVGEADENERASLAAAMARQIETFVRTAPAQWHFWLRLHEFRLSAGDEGAANGFS